MFVAQRSQIVANLPNVHDGRQRLWQKQIHTKCLFKSGSAERAVRFGILASKTLRTQQQDKRSKNTDLFVVSSVRRRLIETVDSTVVPQTEPPREVINFKETLLCAAPGVAGSLSHTVLCPECHVVLRSGF